jgi:hypothetical protein
LTVQELRTESHCRLEPTGSSVRLAGTEVIYR